MTKPVQSDNRLVSRLAVLLPFTQRYEQFEPDFRFTLRDQFALRCNIVLRLAWHRTFATDRHLLPGRGYRVVGQPSQMQKLNAALYDAMYSLLLYGYRQVSGLEVSSTTGSFLCLLRNLISQVDEVFEEQSKEGGSVELLDIFQNPYVALEDRRVIEFLLANNKAMEIRGFLRETFQRHEAAYAPLAAIDVGKLTWAECVELVNIDSGLWLATLIEVIRLFNNHPESEAVRAEFHALGIAGKIADDFVDLESDLAHHHPNLVYAASCDFPEEREQIIVAVGSRQELARPWWLKHAPGTYNRCMSLLYEHYAHIHSPALRLACRLMWLATVWPLNYDKYRMRSKMTKKESTQERS